MDMRTRQVQDGSSIQRPDDSDVTVCMTDTNDEHARMSTAHGRKALQKQLCGLGPDEVQRAAARIKPPGSAADSEDEDPPGASASAGLRC